MILPNLSHIVIVEPLETLVTTVQLAHLQGSVLMVHLSSIFSFFVAADEIRFPHVYTAFYFVFGLLPSFEQCANLGVG